jgi:hypothetical protein
MIAPVTKYAIKGVIWYQGEADGGPLRGPNYSRVFGALIKDWRRQWGEGDFPFLYVQLSSFETSAGWGDTRDSQRRVLGLANTGMAVALDVGLPKNVHPPDKQTVAVRPALAALGPVHGGQGEFSSPQFLQATTETGSTRVWLTHAEGLTTHGMPLGDFEVAGVDHVFLQGTATLETVGKADTVVVRSDKVSSPKYVRYAWAGVVTHYLYNASGLPLGTSTSDPDDRLRSSRMYPRAQQISPGALIASSCTRICHSASICLDYREDAMFECPSLRGLQNEDSHPVQSSSGPCLACASQFAASKPPGLATSSIGYAYRSIAGRGPEWLWRFAL